MRSLIITLCIAAQLAVLAYMVWGREHIIANGRQISLATAPIDPRDPFRGDYVRLRYALNSLEHAPGQWTPSDYAPEKGDKIYAVLKQDSGGLYDVSYFSNVQPNEDSVFIRGRVSSWNPWSNRSNKRVKYGIEQLFVQQDTGYDIEQRRGIRGGPQNAMHANLSVGKDGTAVLTDFSWSPLAMELTIADSFALRNPELDDTQNASTNNASDIEEQVRDSAAPDSDAAPRDNEQQADNGPLSEAPITITISNLSDTVIHLENPGDNCGFRIEAAVAYRSQFMAADTSCQGHDSNITTLEPSQTLSIAINLDLPRWHITQTTDTGSQTADARTFEGVRDLFRIVYRSDHAISALSDSAAAAISERDAGNSPWLGAVLSQGFSVLGRRD